MASPEPEGGRIWRLPLYEQLTLMVIGCTRQILPSGLILHLLKFGYDAGINPVRKQRFKICAALRIA